jgi:NAD(P)-dependent dehydrogenase (short-subunit alcohol dehydrogenase family)
MKDRICMVTGANRGIGKAIALGLAERGATVVMVCRDSQRAEAAQTEIRAASGNQSIHLLLADLTSLASIRQLASRYREHYQRLHVLVNNAGVVKVQRALTIDGLETTFAVNHLAPFLLTNLLLDLLRESAPARIVNVSSLVHKWGSIDFDDLHGKKSYDVDRAYNQSKLANVLFTYELARRLHDTGVTVNSMEPGMTATEFGSEYTGFKGFMNRTWRPFMASPEQAAETAIYLACVPEVAGISGQHFVKCRAVKSSKASYNEELARRLWDVSERLTHRNNQHTLVI